jgi:plasmid stabilization system protein ParE
MAYLVRLSDRALRDLELIYEYVQADQSDKASAWFNGLEKAIYSLERFPYRGAATGERRNLRHLLYGRKPHIYRILYIVDERRNAVNILHIRHGARTRLTGNHETGD